MNTFSQCTLDNLSTFEDQDDHTIADDDTEFPSKFKNDWSMNGVGVYTKTGGSGGSTIRTTFVNTGDLRLNGLNLSFTKTLEQSGGSSTSTGLDGGTLTVSQGFNLYSGTLT